MKGKKRSLENVRECTTMPFAKGARTSVQERGADAARARDGRPALNATVKNRKLAHLDAGVRGLLPEVESR